MHNNPLSNERTEPMEGLQPKSSPVPPTPPASTPEVASPPPLESELGVERGRDEAFTVKFAIGKLNDYVQWFVMVMETVLLIRFLLRMFGANPHNPFASFIFALTDILLAPFATLLTSPSIHSDQAFEITTLIAMLVYFLLFYLLKRFLRILISNPEEAE